LAYALPIKAVIYRGTGWGDPGARKFGKLRGSRCPLRAQGGKTALDAIELVTSEGERSSERSPQVES